MSLRQLGSAVAILVLVGVVGCNSGDASLFPAKGKITYKGQPVADASVTFTHSAGHMSVGKSDANGEFTLMTFGKPGAPVGQYKVGIRKQAQRAGAPADPKPEDMIKMMQGQKGIPEPESLLPDKFGDPNSSNLTATVTEDKAKNDFTFDLTD